MTMCGVPTLLYSTITSLFARVPINIRTTRLISFFFPLFFYFPLCPLREHLRWRVGDKKRNERRYESSKTDLGILLSFLEGNFNGGKCRNLENANR